MAIPFIRDFNFDYGVVDQISPRVQRVIADNPGPFTYTGTGVYIIGDQNVAVIDPGPITEAHSIALDKAIQGRSVTHVLLTHHHSDHSPLAASLAKKHGCKVYGQSLKKRDGLINDAGFEAGNDMSFNPDIEISCGDVFKGHGWTLEAIHTPGHTSNHMCFALLEENILFSGDHIMGWSTSVVSPPDGHMGDYLNSLNLILNRGFDRIWPTHGPAIDDPHTFVSEYIAHRHKREAQIISVIDDGLDTIAGMVSRIYATVDKRLHPAAEHSILAHLIHMTETGRVISDGEPGLKARYKRA